MNYLIWHKVAGLSGAAAVGLGAYGAHAFKPQDPYFLEVRTLLALHMLMLHAQPPAGAPKQLPALHMTGASTRTTISAHTECCCSLLVSHPMQCSQGDSTALSLRYEPLQVFDRGNKYHLLHSLLLAAAPLAKRPSAVGACTTAGILLFSGSCYAAAFTEDKANAKLAPFGGMSLIAAWLCLIL